MTEDLQRVLELERVKAEIVRLRAAVPAADAPTPTVIPFDPARFRKSSG